MTPDELLIFEDRPSDSHLVERVWRSRSTGPGTFLSVAASHCELVVTRHRGGLRVTLRGPETRPSLADCPAEGEWLGIRFSLGTFLPDYPAATLRDRRDAELFVSSRRSFWLQGSAWEIPDFDDAECLVARLVRAGLLVHDPAVGAALAGDGHSLSRRSVQRHFLHATGMTHVAHRQIERARLATSLLRQGISIPEVAYTAGYADQSHLTRALRAWIGETPARIRRREQQLSFLYKTEPAAAP